MLYIFWLHRLYQRIEIYSRRTAQPADPVTDVCASSLATTLEHQATALPATATTTAALLTRPLMAATMPKAIATLDLTMCFQKWTKPV